MKMLKIDYQWKLILIESAWLVAFLSMLVIDLATNNIRWVAADAVLSLLSAALLVIAYRRGSRS